MQIRLLSYFVLLAYAIPIACDGGQQTESGTAKKKAVVVELEDDVRDSVASTWRNLVNGMEQGNGDQVLRSVSPRGVTALARQVPPGMELTETLKMWGTVWHDKRVVWTGQKEQETLIVIGRLEDVGHIYRFKRSKSGWLMDEWWPNW